MSYEIFVAILSFLSAFLGGGIALFLGWKKLKPETRNLDSESDEHSTTAVKTAVESTEIVTRQLNATLADLAKEREARKLQEQKSIEAQKILEQKVIEINNQVVIQDQKANDQRIEFERKFEEQKNDYEKKLYHQKAEYDRKFDIMRGNMAALASQVVQLGGTPIKLMGE